jgi:hypothetical protein
VAGGYSIAFDWRYDYSWLNLPTSSQWIRQACLAVCVLLPFLLLETSHDEELVLIRIVHVYIVRVC